MVDGDIGFEYISNNIDIVELVLGVEEETGRTSRGSERVNDLTTNERLACTTMIPRSDVA